MTQTFIEYHAITALGAIIRKFGCPEQAHAWKEAKGHEFPGCDVITFTRTVTESSTPLRKKVSLRAVA